MGHPYIRKQIKMSNVYFCRCGERFTKKFELKKHLLTEEHDNKIKTLKVDEAGKGKTKKNKQAQKSLVA